MGWDNEIPKKRKNNFKKGKTLRILEESDKLIIPTDKTNSFRSVETKQYMTMANKNLRCSSREVYRDKVREIFEKNGVSA